MSYIQLVSPNLSTAGRLGYCLEYARKCFGAPAVEPNAWTAWNNTKFRLNDTPQGVSYLNWYSYIENGVNLGHVTITTPNGIYSSPWKSGTDHAVLPSIAEVERIYGVKYVGSSQDISNVRVIGENDMITKDDVGPVRIIMSEVEGWNGNDIHSGKDDATIMGAWVGHEWTEMIWHCWNAQQVHRQNLTDQIANLTAQLKAQPAPDPNSVTVSKDGLWASFKKFLGM